MAAAISYLRGLKLPKFKDSKPTTDFIEIMNNLCDVFKSKSKFGKVMKAPLTPETFEDTKDYVNNSMQYLKTLTDAAGKKIIDGPRKTFLIGFGTSAQSIFAIAERLMYRNNSAFEYVLTYKFSQDPLEMFFSKIRSRNGWNNNPNPLQLKWALRALLLKNSIEAPKTANCVIENIPSPEKSSFCVDDNLKAILDSNPIWKDDVLFYISGFIARSLKKKLKCPECVASLYQPADNNNITYGSSSLTKCKAYGDLLIPSTSVFKVVNVTDRLVRTELMSWATITGSCISKIVLKTRSETKRSAFSSLEQHSIESHILDSSLRDDHITILIKSVAELHIKIIFHRFSRIYTDRVMRQNRPSRRQILTKQILFYNE